MKSELIALKEYARRCAVTLRQAQNDRAAGLPMQGEKVLWPAARQWRDKKLGEAAIARLRDREQGLDGKKVRERKVAAEAELAELEVAKMRGLLVPLADAEREWGLVLGRLRARILSVPGKYAPRLGMPIVQAQRHLEEIARELITELADTADDIPGDDDEPDSTDPQ